MPRPLVTEPTEYGNPLSFWVEYPSGLVDLTRTAHLPHAQHDENETELAHTQHAPEPAFDPTTQLDISAEYGRTIRVNKHQTAIVAIDMQNFFLHPDLRDHPTGLACVIPLENAVLALRAQGVKTLWVNWGLTEHELTTLPPALVRGFRKDGRGGFGSALPGAFGRLLMRGEYNSALYGPLQTLYEDGRHAGTDVWIHKNRMSGLWGPQSALDLYLQETGITTLLFAGVNADQCVLGTFVDAYYRGYDCVMIKDAVATSSPAGGLENVLYNAGRSYGFVTDTQRIIEAASKSSSGAQ